MSPLATPFAIGGPAPITLEALAQVARARRPVCLDGEARQRMNAARAVVDRIAAGGDDAPAVYGVNTGFGFLADVRISADEVRTLQRNLIRSHACGVGTPLPEPVVRGMLLLRAQVVALGHSGVRAEIVDLLIEMLNRGVHPVVPHKGSVGASGDLAPLAHLVLVVMGEGEAFVDGVRMDGGAALKKAGLAPVTFEAKEGLSLVNGTQLMTALGGLALVDAEDAARLADIIGALSLEAWKGTPRAFDARIHTARPHPGQAQSAANLRRLLDGSGIVESHRDCKKVQDPYSFRCMPQVHGATRDGLAYARQVLECEAGSATDNPLVFVGGPGDAPEGELISGGNFHGQPVALALDFAGIAAAELANIAERRIEQLVNPHLSSGLPPFLSPDSGLYSGYMMAQVTAAALVSENKILAHPASVDSIPSSAGREDHVSMGVHAADKLARIVDNVRNVLAIELLCAAQGIDLRAPDRPAAALSAVHDLVRTVVKKLEVDRAVHIDIEALRALLDSGRIVDTVRAHQTLE